MTASSIEWVNEVNEAVSAVKIQLLVLETIALHSSACRAVLGFELHIMLHPDNNVAISICAVIVWD